jgi:hypothetical protein|nr:hypothetical protein [uncultured Lachnoclostridium sp.]
MKMIRPDIPPSSGSSNQCDHNWVFQETTRNYKISGYQNYTAIFHRIDRYYCQKCCEIKEIEKKEAVSLPFGGVHYPVRYAPTWYR